MKWLNYMEMQNEHTYKPHSSIVSAFIDLLYLNWRTKCRDNGERSAKAGGLIAAMIGLTTVIKAQCTTLGASLKHLLGQIIIKIAIEKVKKAGLVNKET